MDKNRDVENGVRGQMMHLNPPMEKEAPEEIGNWKTKAPKYIRKENNRFVFLLMREKLPLGFTPMDHAPRLKKMTLYQIQKMRVGTLTRLPPVDFCIIPRQLRPLSPFRQTSWEPWKRGKNDSLLLHARGLAVASFSRHSEARADEFVAAEKEKEAR